MNVILDVKKNCILDEHDFEYLEFDLLGREDYSQSPEKKKNYSSEKNEEFIFHHSSFSRITRMYTEFVFSGICFIRVLAMGGDFGIDCLRVFNRSFEQPRTIDRVSI
jgi:hypothetical protein